MRARLDTLVLFASFAVGCASPDAASVDSGAGSDAYADHGPVSGNSDAGILADAAIVSETSAEPPSADGKVTCGASRCNPTTEECCLHADDDAGSPMCVTKGTCM